MSLSPGTRVGNYEIVAPLGAGGMGEVFRARDTRLERTVAIKSLPSAFAGEPERLARFEREAKLLASVNHPNIASIFGIEDAAGSSYLVLEFLEGETLAQRLSRGPLAVREAIDLGRQVAAALEAAHERGIVHRDLKPANIMFTASGVAKVLDFGLAKGGGPVASAMDLSATPTAALAATAQGLVLGTAPYMSPEQARGRNVDRRTDVWAFGCVLFECLSARQAFAGDTTSDVIARILERDPEWGSLPAGTPPRLRDLVRRCLTKELEDRPRDVGDLGRELSALAGEMSGTRPSSPGAPGGRAGSPSLAVLYFENLSSDAESEYFCAGITEDILTDLSKIDGMRVASRNAVARYRGKPADLAQVAADLGVTAVLEGSVRKAGDRVRITTQLVNAADGFQLWAERFDRTLEDVFAVQEEIASAIAGALRVAITPSETRTLVRDRPNDVRAYDLYLKGRQAYGRYTAASLEEALECFRQATEVDPTYARAFAGIADCHGQLLQWGYAQDRRAAVQRGLEAARHAMTLNPGLADAHKAEALVLRNNDDYPGACAALRRAIELDPHHVPALINLGVEELRTGNVAGMERLIRRSLIVDPQEPFATTWLAILALLTDRYSEALDLTARVRRLSDQSYYVTSSHVIRAMCHLRHNDVAAAARVAGEALADGAEPANVRAIDALVAARTGSVESARRLLAGIGADPALLASSLMVAGAAAVRAADLDLGASLVLRPIVGDLAPVLVRLDPELHPLLDREPLAPRRWNAALVWPLEAPMLPAAVHAAFREVRIESGLPPASEARAAV